MLSEKLIPTPLIRPGDRPPIPTDGRPLQVRFRLLRLFLQGFWLLLRILWLKLVGKLTEERLGDLLREFCQRMGVLWIKLGQLLSMRADLAPPGVRARLASLLDRVQGFPVEEAIRLVEKELGAPLECYFSHFERRTLAAASIAQVHKARLRDEGAWVVIKVRRPDAREISERDLLFLRFLIRCFEWIRFMPQARWRDMLWEIEEAMLEELDFRFEGANLRRMKRNLRRHGIYVPTFFGRYSTDAVLTMEFIEGVLMSDYLQVARRDPDRLEVWREENGVQPDRVARRLVHSFFRQTFEDKLFHSDLHPGNIVLLRNSRIAFLDFGSLGTMERDLLRNVDFYLQALAERQYSKMVDIYFLFAHSLPATNLSECKNEMIRRLQAWDLRCRVPGLPFSQKSFNAIQEQLMTFASTYGISPVWTFFRLTRAMTTMDASLGELIPEVNFHELVKSYYRGRFARTRDELVSRLREGPNLHNWFELQDRFQDDVRFRSGIVRRAGQVFERTTSHIAMFFSHMFGQTANLLLLIGLVLLVTLLVQYDRSWVAPLMPAALLETLERVPLLDTQVWILIFGVLLYSWRRLAVLAARFREQEPEGA
jgi:ubiquinone biosynthesis protein